MRHQEAKESGKDALLAGENELAVSLFSAAIALDPRGQSVSLPDLYSHRSSAYLR
jgi:hypothetical protein